jgi:hypothetical protein
VVTEAADSTEEVKTMTLHSIVIKGQNQVFTFMHLYASTSKEGSLGSIQKIQSTLAFVFGRFAKSISEESKQCLLNETSKTHYHFQFYRNCFYSMN